MKTFTVKELAKYLKVSQRSIYTYIKEGKIPYLRVGGGYRFNEEEINAWLKQDKIQELDKLKRISNLLEKRLYFVALLTKELKKFGVKPILVGGNAVELYTTGGYATADIDIVAPSEPVDNILKGWKFTKEGRYWINEDLDIQVEAPSDSLAGDYNKLTKVLIDDLEVYVIGIEDIIIDRLNAFVQWDSPEDGVWAAEIADINREKIDWEYLKDRCKEESTVKALNKILKELGSK